MYHRNKRSIFLLLLLFVFGKGNAQSTGSLQNQLARKWINAKGYTLKMAAPLPEEGYMFNANEAPTWLWKQWMNVLSMRKQGVPVCSFT